MVREEAIEYIRANYYALGCKETSRQTGLSMNSVYTLVNRLGLSKERRQSVDSFLKENYKTTPVTEIATKFDTSLSSIYHKASRLGLCETTLDETVFDSWNEESAYILGLFITDGSFGKYGKVPVIQFSQSDYEIMLKVKNIFKTSYALSRKGKCYVLSIYSDKLVERLMRLGIPFRKSYNKIVWPNLPKNMYPHFIRGIFDGDGCITFSKRGNYVNWSLFLCANHVCDMPSQIIKVCRECGIPEPTIYTNKHRDSVMDKCQWKTRDIALILNWMYSTSSIFLERKRFIAEQALTYLKGRKGE